MPLRRQFITYTKVPEPSHIGLLFLLLESQTYRKNIRTTGAMSVRGTLAISEAIGQNIATSMAEVVIGEIS
jgi:hypothetical protein